MSSRKLNATVQRGYKPDSGCMQRAIELLLKSATKEGRPTTSGPDDAMTKGSKHDRARPILPDSS